MSLHIASEYRPETVATSVIQLQNASVLYRVPQERISTFKEYAIRLLQRRIQHREFWALRDINLEVRKGEVFGIIGRNGAGKSTLLKLVARVLQPTNGRVYVNGRVAPLLEVSAALHPELTGRENIFLNGALLGFSSRAMKEKYNRIVDFAELWDFIDAPIRTYSSGMVVRLGFSIATDEPPDILIIDEVLSVGDEAFQAKCRQRIEDFRRYGVTILLVSHDADRVRKMCDRAVWIDHGQIRCTGTAGEIVDAYQMGS
jgi:ABC-2 type transport system ATP-binding protein